MAGRLSSLILSEMVSKVQVRSTSYNKREVGVAQLVRHWTLVLLVDSGRWRGAAWV